MPTKNDPRPRRAATLGDPRLPERFWAKVSVNDNGCWRAFYYRQRARLAADLAEMVAAA